MFKKERINNKKGFTLIELLVVIAIIGLLATVSVVSLTSARSRTRDTRRISDIRQMQTALALYYHAHGEYPESNNFQPAHVVLAGIGTGGIGDFIMPTPEAPTPADGDCSTEENIYMYQQLDGGSSYQLSYCLGNDTNDLVAGLSYAAPAYLQMAVGGGGEEPACAEINEPCSSNSDCCGDVLCGTGGYCGGPTPPPGGCFLANSQITMSDGSFKNIEDMEVGDKVLSYNRETKEIVEEEVLHVFNFDAKDSGNYYLKIELENANTIEVTPTHPFAHPNMDEDGLIRANDLRVNDYLVSDMLDYVKIDNIYKVFKPVDTYNLEISNTHTFIVDGVIVGNMLRIKEAWGYKHQQ
jgi:prepilin-type N-terminal cleavage/methylation domain-containing protein